MRQRRTPRSSSNRLSRRSRWLSRRFRTFNPSGHTDIDMDIRVVDFDGEPWFVAKDVCLALGYTNPSVMVRPLDTSERTKKLLGRGGPSTLISEAGLYQTLLRTQRTNPKARAFQDWVTKVVLPTIRKTGSYSVSDGPASTTQPAAQPVECIAA